MSDLKFIALGGLGEVTQNMYLYEYADEMLLVDCGIGFPDPHMLGVDILLPDISYLMERLAAGQKLVALVFSHGHDDHIAAAPYILPNLPDVPLFGSALTAGFATQRLLDGNVTRKVTVLEERQRVQLSQHFAVTGMRVTHSVPDTFHLLIETPAGLIYHGSDFKIDPTPVDGKATDLEFITQIGIRGVKLMTIDCLRVENQTWTKSETLVGPVLEEIMLATKGKMVVTLMSSHLHRIQQLTDAAGKHGRKVAFIGRSVEQNVEVARLLHKLNINESVVVDKRKIEEVPDNKLVLIVAGSQGQEGSSLVRAISGDHPIIQLTADDTVVFSAEAIPGNELNYYGAIDELARRNIKVVYPTIRADLHESGHASRPEQQELLGLVKPEFVLPIGGADRHRRLFAETVATPLGLRREQILLPESGSVVAVGEGGAHIEKVVPLRPTTIDGLGIGDVGPTVLADRQSLSQAGIIVLVLPRQKGRYLTNKMSVVSRGFVFMREADEVIAFIKDVVSQVVRENGKGSQDQLKKMIEKKLAKRLYQIIQREPVIMTAVVEV